MLKISILSPSQSIFEAEVNSVYIRTFSGDAEILPNHADFVSVIAGKIRMKSQDGEKEIDLGMRNALFYTNGKVVKIFVA